MMKPETATGRSPLSWFAGAAGRTAFLYPILILTLWLTTHPYIGIASDARFYNVQFLRALQPAAFVTDLYFRYGSQDDFSVFTALFAPVIGLLGLNAGNIALDIAFQALWLGGLWFILTGFIRGRGACLTAFTAAILLPGGVSFVHYGEAIVTPRLLAEALSLWALGAMLRGRTVSALLVLGLSFSVHPLMTLPAIGVLFLQAARKQPLWWLLPALGSVAIGALAWLGRPPFARLAEVYDAQWFAIVNVRDSFCLVSNWRMEWIRVCNTLVFTLVSLAFSPTEQLKRLLALALAIALAGLAASFVGADVLHLTIVTDGQLWRAFWLLALLANVAFALTLAGLWSEMSVPGATRPYSTLANPFALLGLAAILLALSRFFLPLAVLSGPLAAIGWVLTRSVRRCTAPQGALVRMISLGCITTALAIAAMAIRPSLRHLASGPLGAWPSMTRLALTLMCIFLAMIAQRAGERARRTYLFPSLAAALLLTAAFYWDQRTPWAKLIETGTAETTGLSQVLPSAAEVYWDGDVTVPWLLLRRASYFSCEQGTGALFSRGTALAYQARYESLRMLGTLDFWRDPYCPAKRNQAVEPLSRGDLASACQREPTLDDLVLTEPVPGAAGTTWVPPVPFKLQSMLNGQMRLAEIRAFHIYACADLRSHSIAVAGQSTE